MKMQNIAPKSVRFGQSSFDGNFRYIKFVVVNNHGDDITTVGDISYTINNTSQPNVPMTDFITGQYEVIDWSGYYNLDPQYEPWTAFDDVTSINERWLTDNAGEQYVTLDLGQYFSVSNFTEVSILPGTHFSTDLTTRSIKDFKVLVSSDNNTYTQVLSVTGVDGWQSNVSKTFTIT